MLPNPNKGSDKPPLPTSGLLGVRTLDESRATDRGDIQPDDESIVYTGSQSVGPALAAALPLVPPLEGPPAQIRGLGYSGIQGPSYVLTDWEQQYNNETLVRLEQQERHLAGLLSNGLCNPSAAAGGGSDQAACQEMSETTERLTSLAQDISQIGEQLSEEEIRAINETSQRLMAIQLQQATNERVYQENHEQITQQLRTQLVQSISQIGRGVAADVYLLLIVLSILSTNDYASQQIQGVLSARSPYLASVFNVISTYIVRPFVRTNLGNIQNSLDILQGGYSSSTFEYLSSIIALIFTGASIATISTATRDSIAVYPLTTTIAHGVRSTLSVAMETIRSIYPAASQGIAGCINGARDCTQTLLDNIINYVRRELVFPLLRQQGESQGSSDMSIGSSSLEGSSSMARTILSNASSSQIGSVVATLFGSADSVEPFMREAFRELVQPTVPSTIGSQQASQPISQLTDISSLQGSPSPSPGDTEERGGRKTRRRRTNRSGKKKSTKKRGRPKKKKATRKRRTIKRRHFREIHNLNDLNINQAFMHRK
jgi:hypothetical protein